MNVAMLLEMAAEGAPDRVLVGTRQGGMTASGLLSGARRAAALFAGRSVAHVGMVDLNSDAVPVALFGAAIAGIPFAPVNYRLQDDQLRAIVTRLAPGLVIAGPDAVERIGAIDGIQIITTEEFLDAVASDGAAYEPPFVDPEEIAILLFTSGTTGEPKAAVLRHRHLASYIIGSVEYLSADEGDAQLISVPSYHIAGVSAVLSNVYSGRRVVYLSAFEPEVWIDTVSTEGITQAMVVPTMLGRILNVMEEKGTSLPSLRHLSYGGGRMPLELIEHAMTVMPEVNYVNAYGLTETSSTIAVLTPADHRTAMGSTDPAVHRRLVSVGQPLPSIELEIRGPDGDPLPPGTRGEIYVRGEQVAGEYLGRSVLTEDGWFPTKDAGYLDQEGFLYLDGRLDDVIVRGAENLSPGEIEDTLIEHPSVAEAAVVGVPDQEWGEAVAAAVVLKDQAQVTQEELQAFVRERLRSTKTPQFIQFRADMPYNETGKLLRRVLRDELSQLAPATRE
ncbi:MAG TPA: AMP-binding protein [Acidimicrobiales bacterium]|nr:AMP-binding protein [Acidimicrobiales bacterium]